MEDVKELIEGMEESIKEVEEAAEAASADTLIKGTPAAETPEEVFEEESENANGGDAADVSDESEDESIDSITESAYDRMVELQKAGANSGQMTEATGREFAEMFNNDSVIPVGERVQYRTQFDEFKEKISELKSAYLQKRPLTGRIIGLSGNAAGSMGDVYSAVVMYGPFRVLIPLPYLVELDPNTRNSERMRDKDYMRLLVNERVGSEVDFIPLEPNEKELIAGGDRLTAMRMKRQAYFIRKRHGRYILHEGDFVEARVCYTTRATMHIEVFGIELTLRREDITYKHISSVRDLYQAGDTVKVKITRLIRTEETVKGESVTKIHLEVSAKDAEDDPRPFYLKHMNPGDNYRGRIAVVTNEGFYVDIDGMDMDIFCRKPQDMGFTALPSKDDEVLISITGKNMDELRAFGRITRVIGRRAGL